MCLALALIAALTLGKSLADLPGVVEASAHSHRSLDLQLFNGWDHPSVWYGPYTNTFGNIALFIPLGVGLRARGWKVIQVVLAAAGLSLAVEAAQYVFALGYTDVDDLVCNAAGGLIGALLPRMVRPMLALTGAGLMAYVFAVLV